mgnify:CR=1 FL=1
MVSVLLVDDDPAITTELGAFLERSGFRVTLAADGQTALGLVRTLRPDIVLLDVLLPDLNGREVCRRLRAAGDWTPIIMLTRLDAPAERVLSLEEGADDYVSKPFAPLEIVARIRAVLRRARPGVQPLATARRLVAGPLLLDRSARRVFLDGREILLTSRALALLEYLMLHHGEVLRRDRLLDAVWGWEAPVATRVVDTRIAEIRRALGDDADRPRYIETVIHEGYRFRPLVEGRP